MHVMCGGGISSREVIMLLTEWCLVVKNSTRHRNNTKSTVFRSEYLS